ncbi:hypothetical protein OPQ81_001379 [Rhizoctonia solani]|nr:hypothetical protein OPQ81_001379 [Rhizoctonia solani]
MSYFPVPNASTPQHPTNNPAFYTPQPMTSESKEDIELKDISMPHAHYSDHSHSTHANVSDHKTSAIHLAHEHQSRQSTSRGRLGRIIRKIWLTGFMPAVAFIYLAFCYAAATRVVPVRIWMVNEPANHLYTIKAGVTTVNIIVITLALLPLKSLLDELKGEEFFRVLRISRSGVPLKAINSVSTPSHTQGRGLLSVLQNHASRYYTGALLTGLIATLISSLAPAALSVGVVPVDKGLTAFRVGAVASDSVVKVGLTGVGINPKFSTRASEAASMGWAQGVLGVSASFQATSLKYGVPVPLDLNPTDRARYLTDVAVMDPVCTWTVPNPPLVPPANASNYTAEVTLTLPDFGVTTQLRPDNFAFETFSGTRIRLNVFSEDSLSPLVNITTGDPPLSGVMGWLMLKCKSCQPPTLGDDNTIDMSGIPTQEYQGVRVVGNATEPQTVELSVLMCDPRLSVETREVRLEGSGKITVVEGSGLTRQGNLHLAQTRLLVGKGLTKFSTDSGPSTMFAGIGTAAQVQMFFGPVENSTVTPVLTPRPIKELTEGYMLAQQAAMRSYLSGRMASGVVPGRIQAMTLVFTSSLPHVIMSTILFVLATIFINICYLRSDTDQFTLFSVAAALAHSNVGHICEEVKYADRGRGALEEDVALESLRDRKIRLVDHSLHMDLCAFSSRKKVESFISVNPSENSDQVSSRSGTPDSTRHYFPGNLSEKGAWPSSESRLREIGSSSKCQRGRTFPLNKTYELLSFAPQRTMVPSQVFVFSYVYLLLGSGVDAAKTWARLPVHGPPQLQDTLPHIHNADVALGTPPQNTSFAIDVNSPIQFALTPDCIYCPTEGMYDTSASSTFVKDPSLGAFGDGMFGGTRGYESITLGGLLQDSRSIMAFIDQMSPKFQLRFAGGHLGLFVPQSNETRRQQNVIYRMNEQGQLLNPVWGLRLGGENPQLTIGALDPEDYEGEINWVPLVNDSSMIQIDALKGFNGNPFPLPSPLNVWIDSLSKNIYVPDLAMYMMNDSLIGPNQFINIYPSDNTKFAIRCNGTEPPSVQFSVEINGVDYPVNQTDLIRPTSLVSAAGYCNVGVMKSSETDYTLGVTFLRSVYLAYRFPTGNCPGYYGFATPKGSPTPTSRQKPRTTPTDAATCLSFVTPSSTPSPTIGISKELHPSGVSEETYAVYNQPNEQWVALRGVKDLPPLKVSGGIYSFGG